MKASATLSATIALILAATLNAAPAKQTAKPQRPATGTEAAAEESSILAGGWSALAAGDAGKAAAAASDALSRNPRSVAAAALSVEVAIARGGGLAGLQAYEQWLGSRPLEDGYLVRRCARAILWDSAGSPELGVDALQHLAADDDVQARARLATTMMGGGLAETRALARIGDEGAVRRLIGLMAKHPSPKKGFFIEALVQSRSPLAIPPLTALLADKEPENAWLAADGLGTLNATGAIPQLRRLHQDQTGLFPLQFSTAGALFKMNDMTGLPFLQRQLGSEHSMVRIGAAEQMASRPDGTWLQVVRGLLSDADPSVRLKAARLLAPTDLDVANQTLNALLTDQNPAVRQVAGVTIAERTATDFGTLRRLVRSPDGNVRVRAAGRILELTR